MSSLLKHLYLFLILIFISLLFPSSLLAQQDPHPLRPYPFKLVPEEAAKQLNPDNPDPTLTFYCVQRPTAVQFQRYDKRDPVIYPRVEGVLTSNLTRFVTPLLSVTDSSLEDFYLSYQAQAKRYLADYLGGRAYYENFAEDISDPDFLQQLQENLGSQLTPSEQALLQSVDSFASLPPALQSKINSAFMINRFGVFRKLAPNIYQDELKRAFIKRAANQISLSELIDIYGFEPATLSVHSDTIVGYWDGSQVVSRTTGGQAITLKDFLDHWAPLPQDFDYDLELYRDAYSVWMNQDNQKWYFLWPYLPMFSREDTKGFIYTLPEPGQSDDAPDNIKEVIHPHLARAYELTSALSFMLTPFSEHQNFSSPNLSSQWHSPPWDSDPWWIDSGNPGNRPGWLSQGPVCDPLNTIVYSSGDSAREGIITTIVSKTSTQGISNPFFDPTCDYDGDDSDCYFTHDTRYSPTYFISYTPFLDALMDRLVTGPTALFNLFRRQQEIEEEPPENWLGVGDPYQAALVYTFSPRGYAEAGLQKPGDLGHFYYRYLGFIHCQKEKLLAKLLPQTTPYVPFSSACGLGLSPEELQSLLGGDANCRQIPDSAVNVPASVIDKEAFAALAEAWRPGGSANALACYNDVVKRAQAAGVDPAFALLIWLNESGASNYSGFDYLIEDFGIHKTSNDPSVPGPNDFNGQLDFFLDLPSAYADICGDSSMETFVARFLTGSCDPSANSQAYLDGLKLKWEEFIAPGTPFPDSP